MVHQTNSRNINQVYQVTEVGSKLDIFASKHEAC